MDQLDALDLSQVEIDPKSLNFRTFFQTPQSAYEEYSIENHLFRTPEKVLLNNIHFVGKGFRGFKPDMNYSPDDSCKVLDFTRITLDDGHIHEYSIDRGIDRAALIVRYNTWYKVTPLDDSGVYKVFPAKWYKECPIEYFDNRLIERLNEFIRTYPDKCATRIQAAYRGWKTRLANTFNPNTPIGKFYELKEFHKLNI